MPNHSQKRLDDPLIQLIANIRQATSEAKVPINTAHCDALKIHTDDVNNENYVKNLASSMKTKKARPSVSLHIRNLFSNALPSN